MKQELKSGIEEFDLLVERFENGEITFVELTSALWNKGFNAGYHHQALSQHDVIKTVCRCHLSKTVMMCTVPGCKGRIC